MGEKLWVKNMGETYMGEKSVGEKCDKAVKKSVGEKSLGEKCVWVKVRG